MNIGFPVNETVKQRYSVRTYDAKPVNEAIRQDILTYAKTLINPLGPHTRFQFIDVTTSDQGQKRGPTVLSKELPSFWDLPFPMSLVL